MESTHIGIDLGGNNTGIAIKVRDKTSGLLIRIEDQSQMTWSQVSRTSARHQRRGLQRKRLVKRLVRAIFSQALGIEVASKIGSNQTFEQFIFGLLNRRGFTYLSELPTGTNDAFSTFARSLSPTFFSRLDEDGVQSSNQLIAWLGATPLEELREIRGNGGPLFILGGRDLQTQISRVSNENGLTSGSKKALKEEVKNILDLFNLTIEQKETGHKHRKQYFKDIRAAVNSKCSDENHSLKRILNDVRLSPEEFSRMIGNISNLQLRCLRKYFNDPAFREGDRWIESRFYKVFGRWVTQWSPREDESTKKNRKQILGDMKWHESHAALSGGAPFSYPDILQLLRNWDPALTIPPFENQTNRMSPSPKTLILSSSRLKNRSDWNWEHWAKSLLRANSEFSEEMPMHLKTGSPEFHAFYLQRILDRTIESDSYSLRLQCAQLDGKLSASKDLSRERGLLSADLGASAANVKAFLDFAKTYYQQFASIRAGVHDLNESSFLFEKVGGKLPHKNKVQHLSLGRILGIDNAPHTLTDQMVQFLRQTSHPGTRSKLWGFLERLSDQKKEDGSERFKLCVSNPSLASAAHARKLYEQASQSYGQIADLIHDKFGGVLENFSNPFSLSQLFEIVSADPSGFSSVLPWVETENTWRLNVKTKQKARAIVLQEDTVRPFDGVVSRIVGAQAREIASAYIQQLKKNGVNSGDVLCRISIEENSFTSRLGLTEIKSRQPIKDSTKFKLNQTKERVQQQLEWSQGVWGEKNDRLKEASSNICAYTGQPIGDHGQVDHILPRSWSRKKYGAVFNHESNLIYVSTSGNVAKGDSFYTLERLNSNYLSRVFGTSDRGEIQERIKIFVEECTARGRDFQFRSLNASQQNLIRHAWFCPELINDLRIMLRGQMVARVNGTQKYLIQRLKGELRGQLSRESAELMAIKLSFECERVPTDEVTLYRDSLSVLDPRIGKKESQSAFSHIIDAAMTLLAVEESYGNRLEATKESVQEFLPADFQIKTLRRQPVGKLGNLGSRSYFKAGLFSEHFVPVWIGRQGELFYGFSGNLEESAQCDPRKAAEIFALLEPHLVFKGDVAGAVRGYNEWKVHASKSTSAIYFMINSVSALKFLNQWVSFTPGQQNENRGMLYTAKALDALRYTMRKDNIRKRFFELPQPVQKEKARDKMFKDTEIGLAGSEIGVRTRVKISHPVRQSWENIIDEPSLERFFGVALRDNLKTQFEGTWMELIQARFSYNSDERLPHQRVRKVFSLPVIDGPSGGFRLNRKSVYHQNVQQLAAVEGSANFGFYVGRTDDGIVKWDGLLPPFVKSKKVFSVDINSAQVTSQDLRKVRFSEWFEIEIPEELRSKVRKIQYSPNSKDRIKVRAEIMSAQIGDFLGFECSDPFDLTPVLKANSTGNRLGSAPLGKPRDGNIRVCWISRESLKLEYTVESNNADINRLLDKAILKAFWP